MSKFAFRAYLGALGAILLLCLSPIAFIGGFIVVAFLFIPLMVILKFMGVDISGQSMLLPTIIWGITALFALISFWLFYRAADHWDKGEPKQARASAAIAFTLILIPIAIYLCFKALPGI